MKDWGILLIIVLVLLALSHKASNEETWEWTDFRGHRYHISVHREVH